MRYDMKSFFNKMLGAASSLFSTYKTYFIIAGVVASLVGTSYVTSEVVNNRWKLKYAEAELKVEELKSKSQQVTTETVIKYVDRVKVVKEKGETITKEVPVYITKEADQNCSLTQGFVETHDAAAKNELQKQLSDVNAPSDVALSEATKTVTENYSKYHETAEQLRSLQEWVRNQSNLINGTK